MAVGPCLEIILELSCSVYDALPFSSWFLIRNGLGLLLYPPFSPSVIWSALLFFGSRVALVLFLLPFGLHHELRMAGRARSLASAGLYRPGRLG
ncbi:hypothetical protein U1Q18_032073 [Sarracenia purpurea var. burkii]